MKKKTRMVNKMFNSPNLTAPVRVAGFCLHLFNLFPLLPPLATQTDEVVTYCTVGSQNGVSHNPEYLKGSVKIELTD